MTSPQKQQSKIERSRKQQQQKQQQSPDQLQQKPHHEMNKDDVGDAEEHSGVSDEEDEISVALRRLSKITRGKNHEQLRQSIDDHQDYDDDDDETDDEIEVMRQKADDTASDDVRVVCLNCTGVCSCRKAQKIFINVPSSKKSSPEVVKKGEKPLLSVMRDSKAEEGAKPNGLRLKLTMSGSGTKVKAANNDASSSKPAPYSRKGSVVDLLEEGNTITSEKRKKNKTAKARRPGDDYLVRARRSTTSSQNGSAILDTRKNELAVEARIPRGRSKKVAANVEEGERTSATLICPGNRKRSFASKESSQTAASGRRGTAEKGAILFRKSLRQAIGGSARVASGPSASESQSSSRDRGDATRWLEQAPQERLSDISDFDLSDLGTSDDNQENEIDSDGEPDSDGEDDEHVIEKAEEKALREEYQGSSEDDEDDEEDEEDEDDLGTESALEENFSSLTTDEDDERLNFGEKRGRWTRGRGPYQPGVSREGSFLPEEEFEPDEGNSGLTLFDLPPSGGRGVVTWSDYDSDAGDDDDDVAGEIEDELEELLAISETVVGPVRDDEYDLEELWFEAISNTGDDEESDSAVADIEDAENSDNDEGVAFGANDEAILLNGWHSSFLAEAADSGSSESDDADDFDEGMYFYDDDSGDTTDSLDSDDHVGLVRFGIEVDSDAESITSSAPSGVHKHSRHAPGTASLADVQAPTSADLASLPQHLFSNGLPQRTISTSALTSGTGLKEVETLRRPKKTPSKMLSIEEEEHVNGLVGFTQTPAMGVFVPHLHGRKSKEKMVMIDGSGELTPSPFTKLRRGNKRSRDLLDATPSRRMRADSKVSTTTSATDSSLSGDVAEVISPFISAGVLNFGLNDVLHESILDGGDDDSLSTISGSGLDGTRRRKKSQKTTHALSDLARWNRVPMGAFRSTTMRSSGQRSQSFHSFVGKPGSYGTMYVPLSSSILKGPAAASSLSHTLSSPHYNNVTTKRAIEHRMLTSPVFGPTVTSSSPVSNLTTSSPKSRKTRRKDKKVSTAATYSPAVAATNGLTRSTTGTRSSPFLRSATAIPLSPLHAPTSLVV